MTRRTFTKACAGLAMLALGRRACRHPRMDVQTFTLEVLVCPEVKNYFVMAPAMHRCEYCPDCGHWEHTAEWVPTVRSVCEQYRRARGLDASLVPTGV